MQPRPESQNRLACLLSELAAKEGMQPTHIDGVQVYRQTRSAPRGPMVYRPHIIVVGQGRKRAFVGNEVYTYDPFNYLVLAVPLPAECEAEAAPDKPILMVNIDVETSTVAEMLLEMQDSAPASEEAPLAISTTPMSAEMGDAVIRLLECLKSPVDSRLLGRQIVREVIYRVLQGDRGGALRALANRDDHFTRITRALKYIHAEYAQPIVIEDLAKEAGMSLSVFHHHFKLVTASSPLQYLKRIRLDAAKLLMIQDGYNAATAAHAVGYESPSQFSREFKRLFGRTPINEVEAARELLAASGRPT